MVASPSTREPLQRGNMQVLNYYHITTHEGKKLTFVDIKLKNGEIKRRIPEFMSEKGRWFSFPSYAEIQSDGSKKFIPYWEYEIPEHNMQFFERLRDAVKEYKMKNKINEPQPLDLSSGELPF